MSSLATDALGPRWPPALLKGEKKEKEERRSFTSIYIDVTHTPGRSRVNPDRQEEGKSGHRRRAKGQNSAGGEGNERTSRTNLRGETDLTKTEHTPKPHDTLRRSTGEELGTEWGLVGDGRESTKTINLKKTQFQLQQKSCVTPLRDRSQVTPQGHKQLFKFQRIRCTKCSTSPENHQKKRYHTWKACACLAYQSCYEYVLL